MKSSPPQRYAAIVALGLAMVPGGIARAAQAGDSAPAAAVLLGRARTLEQRGRLDLAREDWLRVLATAPDNAEALAGLVRAARAEGHTAEGAQYLARLRAAHPGDPQLQHLEPGAEKAASPPDLIEAARLAQAGDASGALAIYRRVYGVAPPPGPPALAYYGAEGDTAEGRPRAIAGLRALSDRFPNDNRYPIALGRLLLASPRTRAEGRTLLERYPGEPAAVAVLRAAEVPNERAAGNAATSRPLGPPAQTAVVRPPSNHAEVQAAPRPSSGTTVRTVSAAQTGPVRHQAFAADEQAGFSALNQHRAAEAEQIFRGILARDATDPRALAGLGYLRVTSGDYRGAVNLFEQAQENGDRSLALTRALVNAQFAYSLQGADAATAGGDLPGAELRYKEALRERPSDPEALDGLGEVLLRSGHLEDALPVFSRLTKVRPLSPAAWRGLVLSESGTGRPAEALATDAHVPGDVKQPLLGDTRYQQALAAARSQTGSLVARSEPPAPPGVHVLPVPPVRSVPPPATAPAAAAVTPRVAELPSPPPPSAVQPRPAVLAPPPPPPVTAPPPNNAVAKGGAATPRSHARGRFSAEAGSPGGVAPPAAVPPPPGPPSPPVEPPRVTAEEAIATERTAQGEAALQRGENVRAAGLFRDAVAQQPQRSQAWKGLITALHAAGRDDEASAALAEVPAAAAPALDRDATLQQTAGAVYLRAHRPTEALQSWAKAQEIFTSQRLSPPPDLTLGVARLLAARGADANLYRQLMYLGTRGDLTDGQRREIQMVWTRWAVRRARTLAADGEQPRAVVMLNAAAVAFAGNEEVLSAVADGYAGVGLPREAVALFKAQDPTRGSAAALATAIRAAMAARDFRTAEAWIRAGRERFPNDPGLLTAAAETEQARGHGGRAADLARQAKAIAPAQDPGQILTTELRESPGEPALPGGGQLAVLLAPEDAVGLPVAAPASRPYLPGDAAQHAGTGAEAPAPALASFGDSSR